MGLEFLEKHKGLLSHKPDVPHTIMEEDAEGHDDPSGNMHPRPFIAEGVFASGGSTPLSAHGRATSAPAGLSAASTSLAASASLSASAAEVGVPADDAVGKGKAVEKSSAEPVSTSGEQCAPDATPTLSGAAKLTSSGNSPRVDRELATTFGGVADGDGDLSDAGVGRSEERQQPIYGTIASPLHEGDIASDDGMSGRDGGTGDAAEPVVPPAIEHEDVRVRAPGRAMTTAADSARRQCSRSLEGGQNARAQSRDDTESERGSDLDCRDSSSSGGGGGGGGGCGGDGGGGGGGGGRDVETHSTFVSAEFKDGEGTVRLGRVGSGEPAGHSEETPSHTDLALGGHESEATAAATSADVIAGSLQTAGWGAVEEGQEEAAPTEERPGTAEDVGEREGSDSAEDHQEEDEHR